MTDTKPLRYDSTLSLAASGDPTGNADKLVEHLLESLNDIVGDAPDGVLPGQCDVRQRLLHEVMGNMADNGHEGCAVGCALEGIAGILEHLHKEGQEVKLRVAKILVATFAVRALNIGGTPDMDTHVPDDMPDFSTLFRNNETEH
jgi:hypothetical protein